MIYDSRGLSKLHWKDFWGQHPHIRIEGEKVFVVEEDFAEIREYGGFKHHVGELDEYQNIWEDKLLYCGSETDTEWENYFNK